jgi:hypothetical protein
VFADLLTPFHFSKLQSRGCRAFQTPTVIESQDSRKSCFFPRTTTTLPMSLFDNSTGKMEFQDAQQFVVRSINEITNRFQKVPGSAMLIRYIQSSYQDDPVRSAIELILVIFFIRYLLAPSYSTHNGNFVKLTEEVGWFRRPATSAELTFENRRSMTLLTNGLRNLLLLPKHPSKKLITRNCQSLWGRFASPIYL